MDQARRVRADEDVEAAPRPGDVTGDGLEKVLRFSLPGRGEGERGSSITARDFAAAIGMTPVAYAHACRRREAPVSA